MDNKDIRFADPKTGVRGDSKFCDIRDLGDSANNTEIQSIPKEGSIKRRFYSLIIYLHLQSSPPFGFFNLQDYPHTSSFLRVLVFLLLLLHQLHQLFICPSLTYHPCCQTASWNILIHLLCYLIV